MQPAKKLPTHDVFTVSEAKGKEGEPNYKKPVWTKLGAAWEHDDGLGYNVQIVAVPIDFDGRLVMRFNKPKDEEKPETGASQSDYQTKSQGQ